MADTKTITARSLLLRFLELRRRSPDFAHWNERWLDENPPRLFRLRQLVAMFRAFGIPWNLQKFIDGKFIEPEHPRYAALLAKLAEEMPQGALEWPEIHYLPNFFQALFDYRDRLDNALSFSGGLMVASGLYLHAHCKVKELNQVIWDNIALVEDPLMALISPEGMSFSVEQLARDFGYPDVDVYAIDSDWY